jgi:hypothetical protein
MFFNQWLMGAGIWQPPFPCSGLGQCWGITCTPELLCKVRMKLLWGAPSSCCLPHSLTELPGYHIAYSNFTWIFSRGLCISYFHCCDQNTWQNSLREETFILVHGFTRFSQWSLGSVHLTEHHHQWSHGLGACGRGELITSWQPGSREKSIQEGARAKYSPKEHPSDLLPERPTSYFSPPPNNAIILWIHDKINLFIRSEPSWFNPL